VKRFEYLVVVQEQNRILTANGHWQGEIAKGEAGDRDSCPDLLAYLQDAGAQGWDLVALDPEDKGSAVLYFKRER